MLSIKSGWSRAYTGAAGVLFVLLGACHRGAEPAEKGAPEQAEQKSPHRIRVAPEVLRDAGIEVGPAAKEVLSPSLTLPGEVVAIPDRSARLSTPVAGRIEEVRFNEGSLVKKGERLAVVRVPDLAKVRGGLAASTAKAKAARLSAERTKQLRAAGISSEQAVLDAESQAQAFEADAKAFGDQIAALGLGAAGGAPFELSLSAPVAGMVTKRDVVVGQPVTADQSLAEIADLREVWFIARVYEKDLGRVREGAEAEVQLNAYPGEIFAGSVSVIGAQVDPISRTITARIQVESARDRLRIGLFGVARVVVSADAPRPETTVVPRSALTEIDGNSVVFVRTAEGEFEERNVLVGDAAPGKVAIAAGLRDGEVVATKGVFSLKSIALRSTLAEDE